MRADPKDIDSILDTTIKYMREELGVKKIGAAGYCFGGKYVARFLVEGKGVDAGFSAHPTNLQKAEIEAVTLPFTLAAAETDLGFSQRARNNAESALGKSKTPFQMTVYGSVSHGFAVRGNVADKRIKYAKEEAYLQAVRWFDTWLNE